MAFKINRPFNASNQQIRFWWQCLQGFTLLSLAGSTLAAENTQEALLPPPELLEFLGSFATEEGEWINPDSLLETEFAALLDRAAILTRQTAEADTATGNEQESDND